MAKSTTKARKSAKRERKERRFEPRSTTSPILVQALGGAGALALGAGAYGQFGRSLLPAASGAPSEPTAYALYVIAAGAILLGVAIWFGTSGEPALRVGDGGVAIEKNGERRIPWHAVEAVTYDAKARGISVRGSDESGNALVIVASLRAHPEAASWIVKEAELRAPDTVSLDGAPTIAEARADAGEVIALEPIQVVGRRCADSNTIIAYEPDARVCPRCERVYHKNHVPETCRCGASLVALRPRKAAGEPEGTKPAPSDASIIPPADDSADA